MVELIECEYLAAIFIEYPSWIYMEYASIQLISYSISTYSAAIVFQFTIR